MSNLKYSKPTIEDVGSNNLGSTWFQSENVVATSGVVAAVFVALAGLAVAAMATFILGDPKSED